MKYLPILGWCIVLFVPFNATGQMDAWHSLFQKPDNVEQYVFQGRVVDGRTCEPAPGVEVVWVNYSGERGHLISDEEGMFAAPLGDEIHWLAYIYAQREKQISQRQTLRGVHWLNFELELGAPAAITGTVSEPSGAPISGARVALKDFRGGRAYLGEATTDENGLYILEGIAPGVATILFEHPEYYLPRESKCNEPTKVFLRAGETTTKELAVEAIPLFTGRVLGPNDIPAQNVGLSYLGEGYGDTRTTIQTDSTGAFSLRARPETVLRAEDAILGVVKRHLPDPAKGRSTDNIIVRLNGTVHVTGFVHNKEGDPIAKVQVGTGNHSTKTDGQGRFTLEGVPLNSKGITSRLRCNPPTWPGAKSVLWQDPTPAHGFPQEAYYDRKDVSVKGNHGETLDLDITLEALIFRNIQGVVRDERGNPMSNVPVLIYEGFANIDQWLVDLPPYLPSEPWPRPPRSTIEPGEKPAVLRARALSDAQGQWQTAVVFGRTRNNWDGQTFSNPNQLTVAAGTSELQLTALHRETLDPENKHVSVMLDLAPTPDDMMMRVHLVDESGQPVAGSAWRAGSRGPFTSDQNGILRVPRLSYRIKLALLDEGRCVNAASTTGEVETAPLPKSDYVDEKRLGNIFEVSDWKIVGPGISTESPYIELTKSTVVFNYFDTSKGGLVITLGPCP